jgi:hypothetical protein
MAGHKEASVRLKAAFNLPCFFSLFHSSKESISFIELYQTFSEDDDLEIRQCIASSIHEAFCLAKDGDDTTPLR